MERMHFIGAQGGINYLQASDLTPIDKINLIKMGIGRGVLEKDTEAKLLSEQPSLENELWDESVASIIHFKFVVFKTPLNLIEGIKIPQRMQFKFKFFTFKDEISTIVVPKEVGSDNRGSFVKEW